MNGDYIQFAIEMTRRALIIGLELSLPLLFVGLFVGVIISILQAATQIQEQTLTFIPKIFAVVLTLILILPWMTNLMVSYTIDLFLRMGELFR